VSTPTFNYAAAAGEMNSKALHFLRTMNKSGNQLLNVINDILDAAALKEGTLAIRHDVVDLNHVTAHVLDILSHLTKANVRSAVRTPHPTQPAA
jgi:signal transduction histidine kinase